MSDNSLRVRETLVVETRVYDFDKLGEAIDKLQTMYTIVLGTIEIIEHDDYWTVSGESGTKVVDYEQVYEEE